MPLPPWYAVKIQIPGATVVNALPAIVQILGVVDEMITGRPELAVATTVMGVGLNAKPLGMLNVTVCGVVGPPVPPPVLGGAVGVVGTGGSGVPGLVGVVPPPKMADATREPVLSITLSSPCNANNDEDTSLYCLLTLFNAAKIWSSLRSWELPD